MQMLFRVAQKAVNTINLYPLNFSTCSLCIVPPAGILLLFQGTLVLNYYSKQADGIIAERVQHEGCYSELPIIIGGGISWESLIY